MAPIIREKGAHFLHGFLRKYVAKVEDHAMLSAMELIFEVREAEEGGYTARAPGHSIFTEAETWEELRDNVREAASLHFEGAPAQPELIRLHLVKDDAIDARSGDLVRVKAQESWIQKLEPALTTVPELEGVLAELSLREPIFHRPEFGTRRADFERMTAEDYWETGASGRRYSRQAVLDGLEERFSVPHEDIWETRDFHCFRLSEDTFLLTYTLLQGNQRLTRRATIWRSTADGWKIVYHQGTIVQEA
jgi:predicted RNase H-like HicB family nuclease